MNKQLSEATNTDVETLREELIACKVREAENDLLTKELQQKVMELDKLFQVVRVVLNELIHHHLHHQVVCSVPIT